MTTASSETARTRRTRTALGATAAAVALTLLTALPASAAGVHPSGPLRDAAGATNGCTVTIEPVTVGQYSDGAGDLAYGYTITVDLVCPASAGVSRFGVDFGLTEVKRDGTVNVIRALPNTLTNTAHTGPGTTGGGIGYSAPCKAGTRHTFEIKGRARTMVVQRDPNPFSRTVSWEQTITC